MLIDQLWPDEINIPITDGHISNAEVLNAAKEMKKDDQDYSIKVLKLVVDTMLPILELLFNTCFFIASSLKLGTSVLYALLNDYCGIQVQPTLATLYIRIIAKRLMLWAKFKAEQTAFQKGERTINQFFYYEQSSH